MDMKKVLVLYHWVFVKLLHITFQCYERTCTLSGMCMLLRNNSRVSS